MSWIVLFLKIDIGLFLVGMVCTLLLECAA